jgi:hypothetical protein
MAVRRRLDASSSVRNSCSVRCRPPVQTSMLTSFDVAPRLALDLSCDVDRWLRQSATVIPHASRDDSFSGFGWHVHRPNRERTLRNLWEKVSSTTAPLLGSRHLRSRVMAIKLASSHRASGMPSRRGESTRNRRVDLQDRELSTAGLYGALAGLLCCACPGVLTSVRGW